MTNIYNVRFTVRPSHNDIYVHCNCHETFGSDPNMSMFKFFCDIMGKIAEFAEEVEKDCNEYGWNTDVMSALEAVESDLVGIVSDATKSGTGMTEKELWDLETWRVVNLANAVRK